MRRLFLWFDALSIWPRIFISTLSISIPFYFAAFLSSSVAKVYGADRGMKLLIHFIIFGVFITIIVFFYRILCFYYRSFKDIAAQEHEAIFRAFTLCDRTVVKPHRMIKNAFSNPILDIQRFIASTENIQEIIDDAYSTFESLYTSQEQSGERIDFEVTFMTKSYIDKLIIIPCSANRHGRKPSSMILREKNKEIYNDTETAKLYRAKRPDPIIIPDTSVSTYSQLYDNQKVRIKSSIIYPILSDDNILLGTLVVHCDKTHF